MRTAVLVSLSLSIVACTGADADADDEDTEAGTSSSGEGTDAATSTSGGSTGPDSAGGTAGTGSGEGMVIDCADLDPNGPAVGGGPPGPIGFPINSCNPRVDQGSGQPYFCCSDDPAAPGGALPAYEGYGIPGAEPPIFAGHGNATGTSGLCVKLSDIPRGSGLVENGCPLPCNPLWDASSVASVCGASRVCCHTREITGLDCVLDGDTWRPARGTDFPLLTSWDADAHDTHQDPDFVGCALHAAGDDAVFQDCVAQLGVADRRGFCMQLGPGQSCPTASATYVDACEMLNGG